jgi:hypothetical protein
VDGVAGYPASSLRFADFSTFDLRLFADLGNIPGLAAKAPFFRGARLSFTLGNMFDARQRVTDGNGATPSAYQPYYLDPVGRSFMLTFRKLFFTGQRPGGRFPAGDAPRGGTD